MEVRLAEKGDLDGIMAIEEEAFADAGHETVASRDLMGQRIERCNGAWPGWFYVVVAERIVQGYAVYQPTNLRPEECVSWDISTDKGTLARTFDASGETVFGVSIGSRRAAPEHTGDMLLRAVLEACLASGKRCFAFCSRLPGLNEATQNGIAPEDYWQLRRPDGSPHDGLLKYFHDTLGAHPRKFLRDGYLADIESGGHAALVVVDDFKHALNILNRRIAAK